VPIEPIVQLAVFVVEDNAEVRENLVGALEELTSARVVGAAAGEEDALAWMAGHGDWDLLIVDLFLKGGSGLRLVQRIQRTRPGQKIVVFSNYVNAGVRKRCAQLGVDAVFDKSTEIDALVDYCAQQCAQLAAAAAITAASRRPVPGTPSAAGRAGTGTG
jgi:two-component system, OmpR family, response regulator